jgi:hypothetical protein
LKPDAALSSTISASGLRISFVVSCANTGFNAANQAHDGEDCKKDFQIGAFGDLAAIAIFDHRT